MQEETPNENIIITNGYYGSNFNLSDQWKTKVFSINWENVKSIEDIKIILEGMNMTFHYYKGKDSTQEKLIKDNPLLFKEVQ